MDRRLLSSGTDAPPGCCICKAGFKGGGESILKQSCHACHYVAYNDPRKEQLPRVLKCAHSSCGKCILACLNGNKPITCGVCQEVSPSPPNCKEEDIQALFPLNMYLLGLWSKRTKEYFDDGDSQISFPKKAVKKEAIPTHSNTLCDECTGPAKCFCESCLSAYCNPCFKKVHAAAKVFRGHRSVSLIQASASISKKPNFMCATHQDRKLEFFCTQCSVSICSTCLVSEHNGHNLTSLADQNKEFEQQIVVSYAKVTDVMNIMTTSCKKARQALKCSSEGSLNSSHEQEIKQHFVQLHAQLEIMENDLRQKLNSSSGITSLNAIIEYLSKNIDRIKTTLAKTPSVVRSDGFGDAMGLLQELRELERLPCVLVAPENDDNESCLEIDTTIFKTLSDHIVLRADDPKLYELKTESDAPIKALVDLPTTSSVEEMKVLLLAPHTFRPSSSNEGSLPADYSVEESVRAASPTISHWSSSSSLTSNNSFVMEATHLLVPPDDLVVGITFKAFVSHITSPSDFYIQLFGVRRKLDSLQKELRRYGSRTPPVKGGEKAQVLPGQYYMTMYSGDQNWSRCKILDSIGPHEVKVLYIDFGNHQKVSKSSLRPLPDVLAKIPPLAVRCSIFNCNPRQNNQWDPKVVSVMSRMVEGKGSTSISIVRKNQLNCLTIKLYKETETNTIDVGEALVFLEFAQYGPSESFTPDMEEIRNPKAYPPQMLLKTEYFEHKTVNLTHVVSPDEFYIVFSPVPTEVQLMWKSMSKDYSTLAKRIHDSRIVYYPSIGMAVAVQDEDGFWRRALVVEMLPNKVVKIFLVDDGPTRLVEWDKLRTLELKYFKLQPQAYRCSMADIQPTDGMKWPEEAATLIQSYKDETLCIANPVPKINHTSVLLIHSENEVDICVNAKLVREGLAKSTGPYGEIVEYPKVPILVTLEEPLVGKQNKDFKSVPLPKRRQPVKQVKKKPVQISEHDEEVVQESDGELKLKVTIERVVNPGEFYISVDSNAHLYEEVNVKMSAFYENVNFNYEQRIWELGEKCAVKAADGSWKRAVIVDKPETEEYLEVRLVDDGSATMSVSSTSGNLAVLDPQFCNLPDRVIECTLGGIVPAGSSSWTQTSISEMNDFFDTYKNNLYISSMKLPGLNTNVLRVLLMGREKSEPTAIEPEYDSWPSLNHKLRWKGCAKADEYTKWDHRGNIITERNNVMEDEDEVLRHLLKSTFHTTPEGVVDLSKPLSDGLGTNKIKWPPANPLSTLTLIAKPTYIGGNCDVWIQDPLTAVKALYNINAEATKLCEGTDPPDPPTWETGDICLAKYHLDDKWYRSEIIMLNARYNHHLVKFVDYGNEEYLENHEIRLPYGMTMRPIQAHVCYFDNLASIGNTWSVSDIEEIHTLLVDKHVGIELRVLASNMLGIVKMTLPDGQDALSEIISRRLGVYRTFFTADSREVDSKPEKSSEDNSYAMTAICDTTTTVCGGDVAAQMECAASNPTIVTNWLNLYETEDNYEFPKGGFHLLTIPSDVNEIQVDVTSIWSPNLYTIQISTTDNAELKSISESYNELVNAMQEGAPSQPNLEPPYLFKDCCCKFEDDGMWYRAVVINDSSEIDGTLTVQYVDYGNVQKNLVDQVKQMEETWYSVPVQSIPCSIDGYTFRPDVPEIEAMVCLQSVLIEQPFVKAVIKERGKNLLVEFYNKEGDLCYQPLIDSHHLLPCTSSSPSLDTTQTFICS